MLKRLSKLNLALLVLFSVIIIDQVIKLWIKTTMHLGQEFNVFGDWFLIHFTENNGMAFGIELAGNYGKIALSLFRIVAVFAIAWYLFTLTKKAETRKGLIISIALILAGALGNIIDSAFYGMIFNESYYQIATLFPPEGGYSSFLHGKVVDMFYFPIIEGHLPQWFPIWANEHFMFFRPVFNIADSSISIGVVLILIFQKKYFPKSDKKQPEKEKSAI